MKKYFALFALMAVLFSACSKSPEKVLPRKDGIWDFTYKSKLFINDNLTAEDEGSGVLTFKKDGTVTIISNGIASEALWSATSNTVTLTITFMGQTETTVYRVTQKSRKSETWEGEILSDIPTGTQKVENIFYLKKS